MIRRFELQCLRCGASYAADSRVSGCARCSGALASNLRVVYEGAGSDAWRHDRAGTRQRSLQRYDAKLPVSAEHLITLGEGDTPLHRATRLGDHLGLEHLHIKDESGNPTGSYKDRLSAVAVSYAKQIGASVVATASSGNAGASLAAYAARAGMACVVASMKGAAGPMVAQIRKLGAHLVLLEDKAMRWPLLAEAARRHGWFITSPYTSPVVGSTPIGIEGYKTIAYELYEDLGRAPDWLALPVCYGDALAGVHQGFVELRKSGAIDRIPRLIAAEAHGSLAHALKSGADYIEEAPVEYTTLAASVGASRSAYQALLALRESNGLAVKIGNEGLLDLQESTGRLEGLFFELASVMPLMAVGRLRRDGAIARKDLVICLATASGLKDLDKSTSQWDELAATNQPLHEVLATALQAIQRNSSRHLNPHSGVHS
jgi:threonine synthase